MFAIIGEIFSLIEQTPEILAALYEIYHMWNNFLDKDQKDKVQTALQGALDDAKATKDTTKLTALVNNIIVNGGVLLDTTKTTSA
jgi:hypothetical protein